MDWRRRLTAALRDAWAVLAPVECSGCGAPDRSLCDACRGQLTAHVRVTERGGTPVWVALDYAGVARRVLGAYKDGGRTDAVPALAPPLAVVVSAALAHAPPSSGPVQLVTIPSSARAWRTRGYHPVDRLLRRARLAPSVSLRQVGDVADQVGLGRMERTRNKEASLVAPRRLDGLACLVVDDIVTTGATLLEARRAVREAGGTVVGLVALAETRRRFPPPPAG
ncbi:ComF family protein [Cryobacterium tepidiphilum]|uniref:ComF family protein n=1 Tax=Cryobacterium tepidiphilum TaxID=2486026 RepID=A0A3M8KUQ5_9MICO|nr:phosphoribosyltransferase family protein [Cryobacterium tepidiphilum]RNE56795.1 ComF family protein [Cryobacterium tepidiphilum]